jgi:hypothetical protein
MKIITHYVAYLMAESILKEHYSKTELHQANPTTVPQIGQGGYIVKYV